MSLFIVVFNVILSSAQVHIGRLWLALPRRKGVEDMSDFELLSIMILIIIAILLKNSDAKK